MNLSRYVTWINGDVLGLPELGTSATKIFLNPDTSTHFRIGIVEFFIHDMLHKPLTYNDHAVSKLLELEQQSEDHPCHRDGAEGKAGVVWIPSSVDPRNETRSYARTAHYEPVKDRSNYALPTGHKVVKIVISSGSTALTAESVLIAPRSGTESEITVIANNEVILAAGAIIVRRFCN